MRTFLIKTLSTVIITLTIAGTAYFVNQEHYNEIETPVINEVNITDSTSLYETIEKVKDAVCVIETFVKGTKHATGTGFVYKVDEEYGYILTNYHVIEGGDAINITFNNKKEVVATVMGSDSHLDIAVLQVKKEDIMMVASIGNSDKARIGDTVLAVGNPLSKEYIGTVTRGIISGDKRLVEVDLNGNSDIVMEVIQTDASINPGNSGGPLVNVNGEVIGINSLKLVREEIEGMGFAFPINDVIKNAETLEKGEEIKRPFLGVNLIDIDNNYQLFLLDINIDADVTSGVVIGHVFEDTPAKVAELQEGDIILAIDEEEITSSSYLKYILYKYKVYDKIDITYIRDGEIKTVNTELYRTVDE